MDIMTLILIFSLLPHLILACSEIDESCCVDITTELKSLGEKLDKVTGLLTQIVSTQQPEKEIIEWTECYKGMSSQRPSTPRILVRLPDNKLALCDTQSDQGGWIIFQRRTDATVEFYRDWNTYKSGFGDVWFGGNYWLGLATIHDLTSMGTPELRVDIVHQGNPYYAQYSTFSVGNELSQYKLTVAGYSGNAGDAMTYHNGMKFSTYDVDNDESTDNCAKLRHGAMWYKTCHEVHLNGVWGVDDYTGLYWGTGLSFEKSGLTFTEMKLRLK